LADRSPSTHSPRAGYRRRGIARVRVMNRSAARRHPWPGFENAAAPLPHDSGALWRIHSRFALFQSSTF